MRTRLLAAGALVAVLCLAAVTLVGAQSTTSDENTGEDYPPVVAFLEAVPLSQRFDHLRSATINLTDQNGKPVAINYIPGTVSSVSGTTLVVTPNGETTTRSFNVTNKTLFRGTSSPGSNSVVTTGDRVVVVTSGTSSDAVTVSKYAIPAVGTPTPATASPTP